MPEATVNLIITEITDKMTKAPLKSICGCPCKLLELIVEYKYNQ